MGMVYEEGGMNWNVKGLCQLINCWCFTPSEPVLSSQGK